MISVRAGFYGKLPARGDFLRQGLPRKVAQAWDGWVERVLPVARCELDGDWYGNWEALRPWRFLLAPGLCGEALLSGVWFASSDSVGRPFPLLLAAQGVLLTDGFLDAAEAVAADAIRGDVSPDDLIAALGSHAEPRVIPDRITVPARDRQARWWRGDRLASNEDLETPGWPDATAFMEMVRS
ncbi:type VI secretion system protein ImpM [Methylobacterium sp. OAE515]|uniref:type VI secretion system-associated protein TagF n=1 Tax=Methylobacterium sp. OAE515 TaxID=2817895 RepID=UPI00178AC894